MCADSLRWLGCRVGAGDGTVNLECSLRLLVTTCAAASLSARVAKMSKLERLLSLTVVWTGATTSMRRCPRGARRLSSLRRWRLAGTLQSSEVELSVGAGCIGKDLSSLRLAALAMSLVLLRLLCDCGGSSSETLSTAAALFFGPPDSRVMP